MSKNFELMQEARIRLDIREAPSRAPQNKTNENGKGVRFNWQDEVAREESLKLVKSLFPSSGETSPRVVTFAGIDFGSSSSWICGYAAETLACQKRRSVCLVDANLGSPSLPELFGVSSHYGLTDALSKGGPIRDFAKVVRSDNLWLLSCGSLAAESAGILNSDVMRPRVAELRKEFDYVLIDSPPLSICADGVAIGPLTDGLVLVLEANSTRREAAAKVTKNLRAAQIKILGAVLNKRTFPISRDFLVNDIKVRGGSQL